MNSVLTGSLGNIGKPLTQELVQKGYSVTVTSRNAERQKDIEALSAKAVIGTMQDVDFLSTTFNGAGMVYLMEVWEDIGSIFDNNVDFVAEFTRIGRNDKQAVEQSGIERIVHLSSIGAHTRKGTGSLLLHHTVENILKQLPADVSIEFMRPVGFLYQSVQVCANHKNAGRYHTKGKRLQSVRLACMFGTSFMTEFSQPNHVELPL